MKEIRKLEAHLATFVAVTGCNLHTFTSFPLFLSSRGHSDTSLYSLRGPVIFFTVYLFKQLSTSNAKAASSRKQYYQSVGYYTKKSQECKREASGLSKGDLMRLFSFFLPPFLSRKGILPLIYRHQQYRHVGNEKHCGVFIL